MVDTEFQDSLCHCCCCCSLLPLCLWTPPQVRADLDSAAKLLQKRALKHVDSNNSNASGSTIFMPPPPGRDFAGGHTLAALGPGAQGAAVLACSDTCREACIWPICVSIQNVVSCGGAGSCMHTHMGRSYSVHTVI
jgi:hypothetical protein